MSKKLCVYTCITGNYDNLHEVEHPEANVDYFCFTNNQNLKSQTWQIIPIKNQGLDNCRLARKIKILGHPIINDYNIAVWSDADVIWQKPITDFVKTYLKDRSFAIFKHHARDTVRKEAIACLTLRKDDKDTILKTLKFLDSQGYPDDNGLYESTILIKKPQDSTVINAMQLWFNTVKAYSRRDQLSLNYAIWQAKLKVNPIRLNVWNNPWFYTVKHATRPKIENCHIYYGDSNDNFDFEKYFIYDYKISGPIYSVDATIPCDTKQIEVNLADAIGSGYENITFRPIPESIEKYGIVQQGQEQISCIDHSIITLHGDFKKRQKLSLSVDLRIMPPSTVNKLIEHLWFQNGQIPHLQHQNNLLQNQIKQLQQSNLDLQTSLNDVLNSKGWRTLEKIRKLVPHQNH